MAEYVLLDWDGTLADTLPIWLKGFRRMFQKYHLSPTDAQIIEQCFGNWEGPRLLGVSDMEGFIDGLLTWTNPLMAVAPSHPGVKETLLSLKSQGKKLAVVSTSKRTSLLPALKNQGWEDFFRAVLTDEDADQDKPAPEILEKAMSRLGADRSATLIIGDSGKDVAAGKNAGITTVAFYPPANHRFYLPETVASWQADKVIEEFSELLRL
jgi:pyrophosphatase PpaX